MFATSKNGRWSTSDLSNLVLLPSKNAIDGKIEVDNVKVHGVYYIHKEISIGNKNFLVMV